MSNELSSMTRRQFGLSLGASSVALPAAARAGAQPGPWMGPAIVKKVYLAKPVPTWPSPDLDIQKEKAEVEANLTRLERKHPDRVRFVGGELLMVGDDISGWIRSLGDVDAVLVVNLTSGLRPLMAAIREVEVPMLLFCRPYSGWAYTYFTDWRRDGKKVDLVASSEVGDLDPYMRIFHTIHHLRKSKVLAVTHSSGARRGAADFTRQFGTEISFVTYKDLRAAFDAVDVGKARKEAEEFTRRAVRVVEPSPKDVLDATRFYLGVKDILEQEKANAMTIDCLGGFRRGELIAYPCVAWSRLNDQGFYGVCEADLPSTMTQLLVTSFSGKPGFVSDPVFDTSRNEIVHAHCVSATSLRGIGAPSLPYIIRSHMEDNKGVSLQVLTPVGETVTVGKFAAPSKFLVSTGEAIGNVDSPRGCRTKIRTRVASARRMLENYGAGLHRVVFYGDYVQPIEAMGSLMGFQVVREI
jgi:hypothetical protein